MMEGYNGYKWISYFICDNSGFYWVWTHRSKSEAIKFI